MKFSFTIIIFVSWSTLTTANDIQISLEFPNYVNEFEHLCKNEKISFNFANATIISIGRDFISSPWISFLNFTNTHLQSIEKGAFNNLPNLTQLILSNNKIDWDKFFDFGGHENLKILILNNAASSNNYYYQNKIGFIEPNTFKDTNKLVYLNLSTNNITYLYLETFGKLQSLRTLDLSFNKLDVLRGCPTDFK